MQERIYKPGEYAELMTEYAEHIYREAISNTERNYHFTSVEGTDRETDVCTRLTSGELIAFEVRDRKGIQKIDWVDQVIGKYQDSPFAQVWLCTFDGCHLSSEAIKKLEYYHIGWRDFTSLRGEWLNSDPVLLVSAVVLDTDHAALTIDGEPYQDIKLSYSKGMPLMSYIDMWADRIKPTLAESFHQFVKVSSLFFEEDIPIEGAESNFGPNQKIIHTKLEIPLYHKVYIDYFDEAYTVKNNQESSTLISTHEKSMFVMNDTLVIDFGFFYSIGKHVVPENTCLINLHAMPEKYRSIKHVRFIDVKGEGKVIPMKMYGIRKDYSIFEE